MADMGEVKGHRTVQAYNSNPSILRREDSDQSLLRRGDSSTSFFREAGYGLATTSRYLPTEYESEMQKENYWEQQILNEFELEDDQELGEEDLHSVIGDILANDP